jgi:O-antigen ligase
VIGAPPLDEAAAVWFVVLAFGTALVAWRRPALGVGILVLTDPFALTRYVGHTTLTSFKAALVGALIGLACRGALGWPRERIAATTLALLALLVLATAATIPQAALREPALRETFKALEYALAFVVAWWSARGQADASRWVGIACGAAIVLVSLGAARDYFQPQSALAAHGAAIVRFAGALEGPNQLAAWLGIALPAAVVGITSWPAALIVVALGSAAAILTLSRGGIAQTALALAVAVRVSAASRWRMLAAAAFAAALALGGLVVATRSSVALDRLSSVAQSVDAGGTGSRAILWPAALAMARAHPLLGVGAGNFEFLLPQYGAPARVRTQANSLYLEALADGGGVLLIATVLAALVPPLLLLRARGAPFAFAVGFAGLALAAHGLIDDVTFYTKVGQLWWVLAGVAAASAGGSSSSPSATPGTK